MLLEILFIYFDYLQKDFEKNFQKVLQKQNMWCKRGPKC
jgi:ribosomal protein S17E